MRALIFITVVFLVFTFLHIYIVKRFINKLHIKEIYKKYLRYFLLFNSIGIGWYVYLRAFPGSPNWLFFLVSLPIGVLFLTFITAVIFDISENILKKVPMNDKRRDFFKKSLDYTSFVFAIGVSGVAIEEARTIEVEKVDIKLKGLKNKYSIVQLSDVHIGGLINKKFIRDMVQQVNALKPDLVVITGDLVDLEVNRAKPILAELKALKSVYGTYYITGNHEYMHGLDKIISAVKDLGITVLENENVYIGENGKGFNLAGVYDYMGYRVKHHLPEIDKALKGVDDSSPTVLLAHQPVYVEKISGGVDLMLSGHTHRGQLYPFRPLVKLIQPYIAGLYKHNEDMQVYVNRGTGFWGPPMRLGASSEITYITIF